jgi:hypothetical protein
MIAVGIPNPFPPVEGFRVVVKDGVPPFTFEPEPSPPNPPGVAVTPTGEVMVLPPALPETPVTIRVTDSSTPPQTTTAQSTTA